MELETLAQIMAAIEWLSHDEQLLLMDHLAQHIRAQAHQPPGAAHLAAMATDPEIQEELRQLAAIEHQEGRPMQSYPSLYGTLAHRGPAPSDAELDAARREMWGSCGQDEA